MNTCLASHAVDIFLTTALYITINIEDNIIT